MRITTHAQAPTVTVDRAATRPVIVHVAGLRLAMYDLEARALADLLHDAADQAERRRGAS